MDLRVLNNNLVLVYGERIVDFLSTDELEHAIIDTFQNYNIQPVVTKIPNQIMIFLPEVQMSALLNGATVIITDQRISAFAKRDIDELVKVALAVFQLINKQIIAFGFNLTYEFDTKFNNFSKSLNNKLIKKEFLDDLKDSELKYVMPTFKLERDNALITLKFEPVVEPITNREIDKMRFHANVHFKTTDAPKRADLRSKYEDHQSHIDSFIKKFYDTQPLKKRSGKKAGTKS